MKRSTQSLMRSQFILVYGPGSIIESENGPRLIPSLLTGLNGFDDITKKYKLSDVRMEHLINSINNENKNVNFFKLPSNAAENKNDNIGLYRTMIFPSWKICYNTKEHNSKKPILFNSYCGDGKCPECHKESSSHVRFVCACPEGHLDEVPWKRAVHNNKDVTCDWSRWFEWDAQGSSLASIKIRCPQCGSETTMHEIYSGNYFKCSGRTPEKENLRKDWNVDFPKIKVDYNKCKCGRMKVVQRQSTSLRIPLTLTLLTLPKYDTVEYRILQNLDTSARNLISKIISEKNKEISDKNIIKFLIDTLKEIAPETKEVIDKLGINSFLKIAEDLYNKNGEFYDLLEEEFKVLKDENYKNSDNFNKGVSKKYIIDINNYQFTFNVFPIKKIRTITTQYGYQRRPFICSESEDEFDEGNFKTVPIGAINPTDFQNIDNDGSPGIWYPAFEGIGEGIFITSSINPLIHFNLENNIEEWLNSNSSFDPLFMKEISKPLFVWWHTLSHALIRSLGYVSGYSSASIRERVYTTKDNQGGILLYNTSVGEDCGMGGLINAAENFEDILKRAFKSIKNCSNDPLCEKTRVNNTKVNGASCINCLLISETSCEHRNMWLDRHILLGD